MTNPIKKFINDFVGVTNNIPIEERFTMNKTELVAAISEQTELTKKDSEKALKALIDVVTEELKSLCLKVLSVYLRELPEQERTHRQARLSIFLLARHLSLRQARH